MDQEQRAFAAVGQFACLEVVSLSDVGAFLDVGLDKDLFLPFREQTREIFVGDWVVVFLYVDNTDRDCASMRTDKYVEAHRGQCQEGDRVDLLIVNQTDLGFRAIVDDRYYGVLYANEVFQPLREGQRIEGFIKKVRPDGKIDLALHQTGNKDAEHIGAQILAALEDSHGFLPVHDKSSAEEIYDRFGISKKKFKAAVGGLLKRQLVILREDGIHL